MNHKIIRVCGCTLRFLQLKFFSLFRDQSDWEWSRCLKRRDLKEDIDFACRISEGIEFQRETTSIKKDLSNSSSVRRRIEVGRTVSGETGLNGIFEL